MICDMCIGYGSKNGYYDRSMVIRTYGTIELRIRAVIRTTCTTEKVYYSSLV